MGDFLVTKKVVLCEYLVDNKFCQAINESSEGKITRDESCIRKLKNSCCYLCSHQKSCEISCAYLVESENISEFNENIDREIMKNEERIEKLSVLYAEGKIGEQSYAKSATIIEEKINALKEAKETSLVSPNYFQGLEERESSSTVQQRASIFDRAGAIATLIGVGLGSVFIGYLAIQTAYQYGFGPFPVFNPVRYYSGIFGIISGVVCVILALILLFTRGARAQISNEGFK